MDSILKWLLEGVEGFGAGILAGFLFVFTFAPSSGLLFIPKLWRTWKSKRN